jgi:hypothetical protein
MTTSQELWEMQCFGCTEETLRKSIEDSPFFKIAGPGMIAMSMLSDAQEELARGMSQAPRQTINRAKWVISTYLMKVQQ